MQERGDHASSGASSPRASEGEDGRGVMTRALKSMSYALVFSTLMLLGRALYRTVAVSGGPIRT